MICWRCLSAALYFWLYLQKLVKYINVFLIKNLSGSCFLIFAVISTMSQLFMSCFFFCPCPHVIGPIFYLQLCLWLTRSTFMTYLINNWHNNSWNLLQNTFMHNKTHFTALYDNSIVKFSGSQYCVKLWSYKPWDSSIVILLHLVECR